MRKLFKISAWTAGILILLCCILWYVISLSSVQTWLTHKVADYLSTQLKTKVSVGNVKIRLLNRLQIDHILIEDLAHDTLLSAQLVYVTIPIFQPLKGNIKLGSIELNDTRIYLHRTSNSDDYNYQFILDRFASKDTVTKVSKPLNINFNNIFLHNFSFRKLDERDKQEVNLDLKDLVVNNDQLNIEQHKLYLKNLAINGADIYIHNYGPRKVDDPADTVKEDLDKVIVTTLNSDCWDIKLGQLTVNNSRFRLTKENVDYKLHGVDFHRIDATNVNVDMSNVKLVEDTLFTHVNKISANERSGFVLKSLSTNAIIAPNHMLFKQLLIVTGESVIKDYYAMEYKSLRDFDQYEDRVIMTGHFTGAKVSINDVDYWANALDPVDHNIVTLNGNAHGTVNDLRCKNLNIGFGKRSEFNGNIEFKELTNPDATFISAQVTKVSTNYEDLKTSYPLISYPTSMSKLGTIFFTGRFDGFYKDFVANGEMNSALGKAKSDINLKIIDGVANYSGNFSTTDFDIGQWINQDSLGRVTMQVNVNGKGLKVSNLDALGKGVINSISYNHYVYKDINFDGSFKRSQFNGYFAVKDQNLDLDFQGAVNLAMEPPIFQFRSKVNKANLLPLHLTTINYQVATNLQLDLVGDKIDNINGRFFAGNTTVYRNDTLYKLDSLGFVSYNEGDKKTIKLNSDYANATVTGNFNFKDLPNALKSFFSYYFEPATRQNIAVKDTVKQNFQFEANIKNTDSFTRMLYSDLKNIQGAKIKGYFNSKGNAFDLKVDVPGFTWRKFTLEHLNINTDSKESIIKLQSSIDTIFYKDSVFTKSIGLNASIERDTMQFQFNIEDTIAPNYLILNGKVASNFKSLSLNILPSKLVINREPWQVTDGNSIYWDSDNLIVKNLQMYKGTHFFRVNTYNPPGHSHLNVEFENINLKEAIPDLSTLAGYDIDGTANGYITIQDIVATPFLSAMVDIDSLKINNDNLGNLKVTGTYQPKDSLVHLGGTFKGIDNDIAIGGSINTNKPDDYLNINFNINQLHLPHIEKFISQFVSKMKGDASGNINMVGTFDKPDFIGIINGKNVQATVNYLNAAYSFDDEDITFHSGDIDIGILHLKDSKGNAAVASGDITHDHFRNTTLNIDVRTDMFQFLNTTAKNNPTFYGSVFAKGVVQFVGPLNDININATATTLKGTDFALALTNSKDVDRYSFYRFIAADSAQRKKQAPIKVNTAGVNLNFDVDVTNDAKLKLIMSSTEGDMIQTKGHGNIKLVFEKAGDFTMTGRYEIDEGQYQFNMQNLVSKNFEIGRGSEILWTGDPYDPRLAITGIYKLRAAPYDLVEDLLTEESSKQTAKNRVPVYLDLKLNGSLLTPDIGFDIRVPDADQAVKSTLESKLSVIRLDPNELNKQVVGLLVLNRFLPSNPLSSSSSTNNNIAQGATNTVSEFVANQLSLYLTDWISKFVTEVQLDIKYRNYQNTLTSSTATSNSEFENRRELQLALSKSFFNDKVEVDVGGNFDFGQNTGTTTGGTVGNPTGTGAINNNVTGDFEIRYNITTDGRIKLKVFRKGEYDVFSEKNLNNTGVGVTYRREFDKIKELADERKAKRRLRNEKRKQKKDPPAKTSPPNNNKRTELNKVI